MDYPEDIAKAAEFLRSAVPKMVERQLPANPINYAIWYNYVAKHKPALCDTLDQMIENGESFTPEKCKQLFLNHIVNLDMEAQQATMGQLTQLTNQLIVQLTSSAEGTNAYDETLQDNIAKLENSTDIGEINELLTHVLSSTQAISAANKQFQQQINSASTEINQLKKQLQQAQNQAYVDTLTQLYNRHAFDEQLDQFLLNDAVAEKTCLILADLDHFKSFNDNYGHLIGDRVLQKMGEIITDNCPANCVGTRYGGEEFAIIVTNADTSAAIEIAEILRQRLRQLRVKVKNSEKVLDNISASFGVAQFEIGEGKMNLIDRADKALYDAKRQGRNRVVCWSQPLKDQPTSQAG